MSVTVTGRTYHFTRPRGLAEWAPNHKTRALLAEVDAILVDLADYLPMRRGEHMDRTVQAEALDPPILAAVVRAAIEAELDLEVLEKSRRAGITEREQLLTVLPEDDA